MPMCMFISLQWRHFRVTISMKKNPAESQCIIFIRLRGLTGDTGCAKSLRTLNGDAHHTISLVTDQKHEVVIHTAVIPDKCPNTIHPN